MKTSSPELKSDRFSHPLEELIHSLDGIVWEADAATFQVLFVSNQAERILGYPVRQWLEDPDFWINHLHPDDKDWVVNFNEQAIKSHEDHHIEYRMVSADGRVLWFRDLVTVTVDDDGKPLLRGFMVEITAHRRNEERLAFHALLFESVYDAIIAVDPQFTITAWNSAAETLYGFKAEEVLGRSFLDFGSEACRMTRREGFKVAALKGSFRGEEIYERGDGSRLSVEGTVTALRDDDGALTGFVCACRDMTRQKQAEAILRNREGQFRALIEKSSDAFVLFLPDGRISYASPSTPQVLGYEPEEMTQMNGFAMMHEEDRAILLNGLMVEDAEPRSRQGRVRHKDGSWRWLEGTFTNLLSEPTVGAILVNYRDVTRRKEIEEERQELLNALTERVKELSFLHNASRVLQETWTDLREVLERLARQLPDAFQSSRTTSARICLGDVEGTSRDYKPAALSLHVDFVTTDKKQGVIEVGEHSGLGFLPEELELLRTLGDMLRLAYDRRRWEEQLQTQSEQLRALSASVQSAREEEGTRIAREIHDELGAALTSLRWDLEALQQSVGNREGVVEKTRQMIELIDATVGTVRRIASELRPSVLDDVGLAAAIEWQAQEFTKRTGIETRCRSAADRVSLSSEQSIAVFRVFQEALTNILRHASASRVDISIEQTSDEFLLTIRDNGRGITAAEQTSQRTLGILGMKERVNLIGGNISFAGAEGQGTTISVRVKLNSKAKERS